MLGIAVTFTALGAVGIPFPELLGNGRGLAQLDLGAPTTLALAAELTVLKPLATAACLRCGAIGGLLTPSFATGATFGLLLAQLWTTAASPSTAVSFSLLGAAAVLAVTQRAPVTALVLAVEFAHPPLVLLPALALAVAAAALTHRSAGRLRFPLTRDRARGDRHARSGQPMQRTAA